MGRGMSKSMDVRWKCGLSCFMVSAVWFCTDLLFLMGGQPLFQLVQRFAAVADFVLLGLVHLRVCLAFVLKARVPACRLSARKVNSKPSFTDRK